MEGEMRRRGIMTDTRKPNVMRVAPTPLYNRCAPAPSLSRSRCLGCSGAARLGSFEDVHVFVTVLATVLATVPPAK